MNSPYSPPPPPPGYYPAPYPPPRSGVPVWVWVLAAVLLVGLGTCGAAVGLVAWAASGDPAGVILGAQVPPSIREKLRSRGLVSGDERVVAFYDVSIASDLGEIAMVTSEAVVYAKGKAVTRFALGDVDTIHHHTEGLLGDIIEISTKDGDRMRVEIAPLNMGASFLEALEDTVRKQNPDVVVRRRPDR